MIRRILVDHARKRGYAKRGGGAVRVPLEELRLGTQFLDVDVVALDQALAALGRIDPRKVRVVQLRYFAGLSVEETAQVMQVSRKRYSAIGNSPRRGCSTSSRGGAAARKSRRQMALAGLISPASRRICIQVSLSNASVRPASLRANALIGRARE